MDLIEKIQALHNKAQSTSFPEERDAFLTKVNELVEQHQLDLAKILESRPEDERGKIKLTYTKVEGFTKEARNQNSLLLGMVATLCFCKVVFDYSLQGASVIGKQEDIDTAIALTKQVEQYLMMRAQGALLDAMNVGLVRYDQKGKYHPNKWRSDYISSAVMVIHERIRGIIAARQVANTEMKAIVLVNDKAIEEHISNVFGKLGKTSIRIQQPATVQGVQAGREASLTLKKELTE